MYVLLEFYTASENYRCTKAIGIFTTMEYALEKLAGIKKQNKACGIDKRYTYRIDECKVVK